MAPCEESATETETETETETMIMLARHRACPVRKADDDPMFQQAYAWMKTSMADAGLRAPADDLSPWWCWIKRKADHPRPYIEDLAGLEDPVVLRLSIPSHLIALSCFDLWHFVLNRWYVPTSDEDDADFDGALKAVEEGSEAAWLLQERLRQSCQPSSSSTSATWTWGL